MKLQARCVLAALLLALLAAPSHADIIVYGGPGFIQPDENLLFNKAGLISTGNPVTGATNQTGLVFNIGSNEILTTPAGGQARIQAVDGAFSIAVISPNVANPNFGFTELEFNVNVFNKQTGVLQLDFTGVGFAPFSTTVDLNNNPLTLGNGANWIGIQASNGQFITSVTLTSLQNGLPAQIIDDLRLVRVSGVTSTVNPGGGGGTNPSAHNTPEPASVFLWGALSLAVAGTGWVRRRRAAA